MILIADCGSTKTDWCLLDHNTIITQVFTRGMNALLLTEDRMTEIIATELIPQIGTNNDIDKVFFYGAGCISTPICESVEHAIRRNIPSPQSIEVNTDLLAAARALCGREAGIACILGTGSNSCYYDGNIIVDNVSPLGYVLGDEGSGAVLGKRLVGDVLKRQLPENVTKDFFQTFAMNATEIIQTVYRKPSPNRFLASLSPFISKHINEPSVHNLVFSEFKAFFQRNVANYERYQHLPCNFVGSIAYYFKDVLEEAARSTGVSVGAIIKNPMEGLVRFHTFLS